MLDTAFRAIGSYYLGDLLGQILLQLGEAQDAQQVYKQVTKALDELAPAERNVWTRATSLTAAIVLKDFARMDESLTELRKLSPSREELDSIERGIAAVVEQTRSDPAILERLKSLRV